MGGLKDRRHTWRPEQVRADAFQRRSVGDDVVDVQDHLVKRRPRVRRGDREGANRASDPSHPFGERQADHGCRETWCAGPPEPGPQSGDDGGEADRDHPEHQSLEVPEQSCCEEDHS